MSNQARLVAFDVLRQIATQDSYVNLLLPQLLRERQLTGRDAAFATELTHGALRWQGSYDAIVDHLAKQGVQNVDPPVLDALRLGLHQVLHMRVPDHAALATTGQLVRKSIGHKPVGFVNAILRKATARTFDEWTSLLAEGLDETGALAVRYSHPRWIVDALRAALDDPAELEQLLAAQNDAPRVTLVARPGLVSPDELPGEPGQLSPFARILPGGDPGELSAVRSGAAAVQDEGSQLVAITVADTPISGRDDRWLDLCAGPGGKAALLAAIGAQQGVHVTANEPQAHRAKLVRSSVRALSNVDVVQFDGRHGPWDSAEFDRVLVDAPCTGLGALRRRPESRWRRQPSDLGPLVELQTELLRRALEVVRPGGIVGYATCSPVREETHGVVEQVVADRDDVEIVRIAQWWPHRDHTDAMFLAVLARR